MLMLLIVLLLLTGKSIPDMPFLNNREFAKTLASCTFPGQPIVISMNL